MSSSHEPPKCHRPAGAAVTWRFATSCEAAGMRAKTTLRAALKESSLPVRCRPGPRVGRWGTGGGGRARHKPVSTPRLDRRVSALTHLRCIVSRHRDAHYVSSDLCSLLGGG